MFECISLVSIQIHISTAALMSWTFWAIDTIFKKRWYRDSWTRPLTDLRKGVLSRDIEVDPKRFIDNNGFFLLENPCNDIVVAQVDKSSPEDEKEDGVLFKVLRLLDKLDGHEDVRPSLKN